MNLQITRGTACNGRQANEHGTDGNHESKLNNILLGANSQLCTHTWQVWFYHRYSYICIYRIETTCIFNISTNTNMFVRIETRYTFNVCSLLQSRFNFQQPSITCTSVRYTLNGLLLIWSKTRPISERGWMPDTVSIILS